MPTAVQRPLSFLLLLLSLPLWVIIATAIKLDSRGPVIFRQERIGKGGRTFVMYKFRSMRNGTDPALHRESFRRYAQTKASHEDPVGRGVKPLRDPRITRVGQFLRATNLDELPQLVNVVKGEMSLVGPRPAISYELEWYQSWYYKRFDVLPGITGIWQVKGRYLVGLEEMITLDLEYVRRRSFLLDLQVLLLTVPALLLEARKVSGKATTREAR